jgi:hypothetical protein
MMAAALTLMNCSDVSREIFLYDTFEGMPPPSNLDKSHAGVSASELLLREKQGTGVWCFAGIDEVRGNLQSTGYPDGKLRFIKGKVEETIPDTIPKQIGMLRLDTDWYKSTKHELIHLFPLMAENSVLIIDDYGHWEGAKIATDEFFEAHPPRPYFHRIDYTGRIAIIRDGGLSLARSAKRSNCGTAS